MSENEFLFGETSWAYIAEQYRKFCTDPSFVDYFWTVRIMHAPIWRLAKIARTLIPAKAYHTVSTGYAGFLGALLRRSTGRPLLLSEHGIYTKERKIDLFQSDWIRDNRGVLERDPSQLAYFKDLWIRFFEALGRACYDQANKIVALYETNRLRQLIDGAQDERTMNIPNGINLGRMAPLREKRAKEVPPVLCLIGRVVPIKDVETFVRAMRTVVDRMPNAEGWIAGPEDEDRVYAEDCKTLARNLGLENAVKFLGFQKIDELLPKVGLVVLSSISEALPLVVLEGYAAGVPVVTTDVGSCRQLVEGLGEEDRALGRSGRVVRIADAEALALASVELLSNPHEWHAAQQAGIKRVEKFYTQEMMFGAYRKLYRRAVAGWPDESEMIDVAEKVEPPAAAPANAPAAVQTGPTATPAKPASVEPSVAVAPGLAATERTEESTPA
jgi:glycosyltransferase involved in cell wall biosynthesis